VGGSHRDGPEPSTDTGTVPLGRGAAHLAPRFAGGTRQTGGTHGAGGASVARRAGCSLFPRFALMKGRKTKAVSRGDPGAARHRRLILRLPEPPAPVTALPRCRRPRWLLVALQNPKPHPGLGSLGYSSCTRGGWWPRDELDAAPPGLQQPPSCCAGFRAPKFTVLR